jgi:hypothetical protein
MSYFPDLTPHTYTPIHGQQVLNVGWLDVDYPFPTGETSSEFREALRLLCEHPIFLHRGFHPCPFCPHSFGWPPAQSERRGNGQIRVKGFNGIWYAAPKLICHYVDKHGYLPPEPFVDAVLYPADVATGTAFPRGVARGSGR